MAPSRGPGRNLGARRPSSRPGAARPGALGTARARAKAAAQRRRTAPKFTGRAAVLLAIVLLLIASYTSALHAWWEQRQDNASLRAEIVMHHETIGELEDTRARWNDPAYVKQQARERFGWVMPGEVGYRVIGDDGLVQGDVPQLAEPPTPKQRAWYDTLWGSVEAAGREPSAAKAADPDQVGPDQEGQ